MAAAQQGDPLAYQKLLEDLLPVVRRLVRGRLFDPDSVEDVVQNSLLKVHRARHSYRPERPFGPWLRAVVRNATIDHMREHGRRAERELRALSEPIAIDPGPGPAGRLDEALSPELLHALEALPPAQRQAVEWIHLEGLTVAQAALRAGVTPSALKVRAHRGYRALRTALSARVDSGNEPGETQ